jgi:hypothetical protein
MTSIVIDSLFDHIHNRLKYFPIASFTKNGRTFKHIYDPNLNFDSKLRENIVFQDIAIKEKEDSSNWIAIVWSREQLVSIKRRKDIYEPNVLRNKRNLESVLYKHKNADLTLNVNFICSSISLCEDLEEHILTHPFEQNFPVEFRHLGTFDANIQTFDITGLSEENYDSFGSIVTLSTTMLISFPLVIAEVSENPEDYKKLIGKIIPQVYTRNITETIN